MFFFRQEKLFELNLFVRKDFFWMAKPTGQIIVSIPCSQSINFTWCLVLNETSEGPKLTVFLFKCG